MTGEENHSSMKDVSPSSPTSAHPEPNPKVRRLGIRALGWHAYEKAIPLRILNKINGGEEIKVKGIIPVLADLCEHEPTVQKAYLCHSSVQQITKMKGEGSFCGYRNIQMLISYVLDSNPRSSSILPDGIPSIFQIQDLIEDAWDRGINPEGRIETGGIRGTRKHIGTPEAQALFKGLGIACRVKVFNQVPQDKKTAWESLTEFVQEYFSAGSISSTPEETTMTQKTVHRTDRPPIYLQRPHHSLIIVGYQILNGGKFCLLVFDPAAKIDPGIARNAIAATATRPDHDTEVFTGDKVSEMKLKSYQRTSRHLSLYKRFEILILT